MYIHIHTYIIHTHMYIHIHIHTDTHNKFAWDEFAKSIDIRLNHCFLYFLIYMPGMSLKKATTSGSAMVFVFFFFYILLPAMSLRRASMSGSTIAFLRRCTREVKRINVPAELLSRVTKTSLCCPFSGPGSKPSIPRLSSAASLPALPTSRATGCPFSGPGSKPSLPALRTSRATGCESQTNRQTNTGKSVL